MIKKISINNFKSIKHIEFDIPNFTIVVGNNAAGKTNLLKAVKLISLLSQGNQIDKALSLLQLLPSELLFDKTNNKIAFSIELTVNSRYINYSFELSQEFDGTKYRHRVLSELLTNGRQDIPILRRSGQNIQISPKEGVSPSAIGLEDNQLAISTITDPIIVMETKKILSKIIVDTFAPISLRELGSTSKVDMEFNSNLAEKLYALTSKHSPTFNEIQTETKEIISGLDSITIGPLNNEGNLYIKFKEAGITEELTFYSASDGNLRSLGILSALLGDPQPSVLFIDEVENSLHPKRIRALVKFLNFISEKENNSVQIVITTHSPIALNCVSDPQIRYIYKKNNETKVSKPSKQKEVMEYLKRGLEDGIQLGDLFEEGILETIFTTTETDEN